MAFYSVRVDDEGKEIDTTRRTSHTFRKILIDPSMNDREINKRSNSNTSIIMRNDHHKEIQNNHSPVMKNTYKTVRYVNSATFIEKDSNQIKKIQEEENSQENRDRSIDLCTTDASDHQYQSHIVMESVPSLELNSNESFQSSGDNLTYSYRKVCEVTKIIKKPDAYREWLAAKRIAKSYEHQNRVEQQQREENERKERRQIAEQKFREWLMAKREHLMKTKQEELNKNNKKNTTKSQKTKNSSEDNDDGNDADKRKVYLEWLRIKLEKVKEQKEKFNENEKRKQELQKKRREQAEAVYKEWLKTAPYKPKPVPLNRGLFTLKGSVSQIYVNPRPWVSSVNDGNDDDDGDVGYTSST